MSELPEGSMRKVAAYVAGKIKETELKIERHTDAGFSAGVDYAEGERDAYRRVRDRVAQITREGDCKQIIVATDCHGHEAIYVDGRNVFESGHAYAIDIATAAGEGVITFRQVNVDLPEGVDGFPETIAELRAYVSPVEEPLAATPQRPSLVDLMAVMRELNEATNPLVEVDQIVLHRARVKAQELLDCLSETEA